METMSTNSVLEGRHSNKDGIFFNTRESWGEEPETKAMT